jgi:putative ABC transport system substrate-binding protein
MIRRREFIAGLGGAAAVWPLATHAQQAAISVIGFLGSGSPKGRAVLLEGFRQSLIDAGYIEGKNLVIDYRWAEGEFDRLPALAADLVRRRVNVIVTAAGGVAAALAAKAATSTIPIVFTVGFDPVRLGLVASLNRPGGNATGVTNFAAELRAKGLGLFHDLVPQAKTIGMLVNPKNQNAAIQVMETQIAASTLGLELLVLDASNEHEIDAAFETLARRGISALIVGVDAFFASRRDQIVEQTARHAISAVYPRRADAVAGGLMSYGVNTPDTYRQLGVYVGRILKGEKPADLPVVRPTKFEFVINLKTAKALGLTVPPTLFAIADEVIE